MDEIWKAIPKYEGIYEASNLGRVRTIEGKTTYSNLHGERHWKSRILKFKESKKEPFIGYRVTLWKDKKPKDYLVHRLVATTFLENLIDSNMTVNHKDGNRRNNKVENLEWVTIKENVIYSLKNKSQITKRTSKYGKYIKHDKRYGTYNVVVPIEGKRTYLGGFKNPEEAMKKRDSFLNNK